jgi:phosphomannomutase/phosphoglucomutase
MKAIFREYDIRGIVNEDLTPAVVLEIGRAIGTLAAERGERRVAVARDGRLSSPLLCDALKSGIKATGQDVIDLGAVPTPLLYYATQVLDTRAGVMVTGSHNPPEYNGLKVVMDGMALHGEVIRDLYQRLQNGRLRRGQGRERREDVRGEYIKRIGATLRVTRPLKVVVDCGNAIAGEVAPALLRTLGCEVVELHCQVDGRFPHHHPDPSQPENLAELCVRVLATDADLGLAFDGDADRLGVVTDAGEIIWPDRVLMALAREVLERHPGASVVYDIKCSRHLARVITQYGGVPILWKTGHAVIKAHMREIGALLGGEMSGHFIHADDWFGFDDALYAAARLLGILARDGRSAARQFALYPTGPSTPELLIPMAEGEPFAFMTRLLERANFGLAQLITVDGLRVEFEHGWGLVRASHTTPSLTLRFEADDARALAAIQALFRRELLALEPHLSLPF